MKRYFLLLAILSCCLHSIAQQSDSTSTRTKRNKHAKPAKPPVCYIGLSTGLDNPAGVFGLDFNIRVANYITIDAGAGPGTWGNKLYLGGKYYLKEAHRGWALAGGFTFSSGEENVRLHLSTLNNGTERISLSLKPEDNAFIAIYHYWNLGKKYNRFFVDFGKSIALTPPHYHEIGGDPLSDQARNRIRNLSPGGFLGGIMLGVGVNFGLYRK
jgi:hypothetical protein